MRHRKRNPATLKTTLCRWFLLTHWRLWTFLGSSVSPAQEPHLTRAYNFLQTSLYNAKRNLSNLILKGTKKDSYHHESSILKRVFIGRNSFAFGYSCGLPNGICAPSFQLDGRFQVRFTSSSIIGL